MNKNHSHQKWQLAAPECSWCYPNQLPYLPWWVDRNCTNANIDSQSRFQQDPYIPQSPWWPPVPSVPSVPRSQHHAQRRSKCEVAKTCASKRPSRAWRQLCNGRTSLPASANSDYLARHHYQVNDFWRMTETCRHPPERGKRLASSETDKVVYFAQHGIQLHRIYSNWQKIKMRLATKTIRSWA